MPRPETNFSVRPWGGRKIHKFALGAEMASHGPDHEQRINLKYSAVIVLRRG
jgi:hypothetical protein